MSSSTKSLVRTVTYRAFKDIRLDGQVLDLGGSRKSGYHELFQGNPKFTVVNIDEHYGYDLLFNVEHDFPLEDATYDHVLCINLLEHTFRYQHVLEESFRVLKPGGSIILVTPFSVAVHGCPHDYFRYTDSALKRMLEGAGFTVERVDPNGYGVFACMYQYGSWLLPSVLRRIAMKCAAAADALLIKISKRYAELSKNYVLGYLSVATKPAN